MGSQSTRGLELSFEPAPRPPRLSDHVAETLLASIAAGSLQPGDRLPSERVLSEQFGVSRTVIREATRSLAARGVVESRAGSGLVVATMDPSALTALLSLYLGSGALHYGDVHEVRAAIESRMTALAATRRTDADLAELRAALEILATAAAGDDVEATSQADVEFHRTIARMTHNSLFVMMLDSIGDILLEVRRETLSEPSRRHMVVPAHERIVLAIEAGDAAAARTAMDDHLEESFAAWTKPLGEPGATGIDG